MVFGVIQTFDKHWRTAFNESSVIYFFFCLDV
jgi:hypothetical protein